MRTNDWKTPFFTMLLAMASLTLGCISGSSSGGTTALVSGGSARTISGRVTASGTIVPARNLRIRIDPAFNVAEVLVWLQGNPGIRVTSNADGSFLLTGVPIGVNRVVASIESGNGKTYKIRSNAIEVSPEAPEQTVGELTLEIAQNRARGIIRDADGNPVANAELSLWGETFFTGPDGSYLTPPLPDAELIEEILVKQAGNLASTTIVAPYTPDGQAVIVTTLAPAGSRNKAPNAWLTSFKEPTDKILPGETVNLWAVLLDANSEDLPLIHERWAWTGGALASASVPFPEELKRRIPNTDLSQARISAVTWTAPAQSGNYKIEITVQDPSGLEGAALHPLNVFASESDPPPVPVDHPPSAVLSGPDTVIAGAMATFSVEAADPDLDPIIFEWTSNPSAGVFNTPRARLTGWKAPSATGTYRIACKVTEVRTEGLATTAELLVTVVPDPIVVRPGMIAGHVLDRTTRQPIPRAVVAISGTNIYTIADDSGYFEFKNLAPGTYDLIATKNGYQARTYPGIVVPAA